MTQHSDTVYLRHMLAHAREALDIYSEHSGREFADSRVLQLALLHLTEIIGEAASKVSATTRLQLTQLPWRGMIGMRNRIIHGYDTVNKRCCVIRWNMTCRNLLLCLRRAFLAKKVVRESRKFEFFPE